MKTVVYLATKNLYKSASVCINSLQQNGNVDEVFILTEGGFHKDGVTEIDVSDQTFFPKDSMNAATRWTWMCLMKTAMTEIFPDNGKVLILDCDTIVEKDLSPMWEYGIDYYGACKQYDDGRQGNFTTGYYFNAGVLMCNLNKLRDGTEAEIRRRLNEKKYDFPEQDCINEVCRDHITLLPSRYNHCQFTLLDDEIVIRHFAAFGDWVNGYWFEKYEVLNGKS